MSSEEDGIEKEDFCDAVELALTDNLGEKRVYRNHRMREGMEVLDFYANGRVVNFALEVATTLQEMYAAIGRIQIKTENMMNTIPVVVVPCGGAEIDYEEKHRAEQVITLVEVNTNYAMLNGEDTS